MAKALLIVDVQNDFCEGGSLAVAGGAQVARDVSELLRSENYPLVVASRDAHNPLPDTNGGHFAPEGEQPNFVDSWPVHCVLGTNGAAYHPDLHLPPTALHVIKGMGRPDYSAFQGETDDFARMSLAEALRLRGVTELDVVGIATEHCVRASALHSAEAGFRTRVLTDLTAGIDPLRIRQVLQEEFPAAGVLVS